MKLADVKGVGPSAAKRLKDHRVEPSRTSSTRILDGKRLGGSRR
jgi:hypothetical protein